MIIEIKSEPTAHMESACKCPHCKKQNSTERVFLAHAVSETPDIWAELNENEKHGITSIDEALQIAKRLNLSNKVRPLIQCEFCDKSISLAVTHTRHEMQVPAFMSCSHCNTEIDLRYPGDAKRIHFTAQFPHVPFLHCRECKKRVLIPVIGKESWRNIVFRIIYYLKKFLNWRR